MTPSWHFESAARLLRRGSTLQSSDMATAHHSLRPPQRPNPHPHPGVHLKGSQAGHNPRLAAAMDSCSASLGRLWVQTDTKPLFFLTADRRASPLEGAHIFIILRGINLNNFHSSRNFKYLALKQNYTILGASGNNSNDNNKKKKMFFSFPAVIRLKCCISNTCW